MNNITRAVGQALFIGVLLLFVIPAGYLAVRIGDTWTQGYTEQMLGALTALCGGGLILVALLVGAGLYVKLSGGRFSRREPEPPPVFPMEQPHWNALPPPQPPANEPPPWGVTGGGRYDLLPPPMQDARFSMKGKG
ncbi:MAG: hypothetical protein KF753_22210 [Caldilineaceae bacterium]|nr:hypothetical protein [Caldilineaceae bacterium]